MTKPTARDFELARVLSPAARDIADFARIIADYRDELLKQFDGVPQVCITRGQDQWLVIDAKDLRALIDKLRQP